MIVSRPPFGHAILCFDEFLDDADAQCVLDECIRLHPSYVPATILDGSRSRVVPTFRKNDVVDLDTLFSNEPERAHVLRVLRKAIWRDECKCLWHEGGYIFDVINYSTHQQAVISRYGNCDFYEKHQDTRRDHITYRLVTLVYYVNRVPEPFTGGALTFWHGNNSLKIEPKHNRAVVFPSFTIHEVESVRLHSDQWEDGRFSINYWLGFR